MKRPQLSTGELELIDLCHDLIDTIASGENTTHRFTSISNKSFEIYRKSLRVKPYIDPGTM